MSKKILAFTALLSVLMTGCQTLPTTRYATGAPNEIRQPGSSVTICRLSSPLLGLRDISVVINDEYVTELSNGQIKQILLAPGQTKLELLFPSDVLISNRRIASTFPLAEGENRNILFGSNLDSYVPLIIPGVTLGALRFQWTAIPVTKLPDGCNERNLVRLKKS